MGSFSLNTKTPGKDLIAGLTAAIAGVPAGMASAILAGLFMLLMGSLKLGWLNNLQPTIMPDFSFA